MMPREIFSLGMKGVLSLNCVESNLKFLVANAYIDEHIKLLKLVVKTNINIESNIFKNSFLLLKQMIYVSVLH